MYHSTNIDTTTVLLATLEVVGYACRVIEMDINVVIDKPIKRRPNKDNDETGRTADNNDGVNDTL